MKLIKTSQTTPIQAVTETTLESNSNINAPTIKAVVDSLYRPNLLVNGDFQINQRGQSEYTGFKTGSYNLDMWKNWFGSSTTKSVEQVENGIDIYGDKTIALEQFVDYKNGIDKMFSIGCSFDNKRYEFTFTLTDTSQPLVIKENVNLSVKYEVEKKCIGVALWCNDGVKHTVNYIDLFEGAIAYPHTKEDYTVALMRCKEWLIVLNDVTVGGYTSDNSGCGWVTLPFNFKKKPTLTFEKIDLYQPSVNKYDEVTSISLYGNCTNLVTFTIEGLKNKALQGLQPTYLYSTKNFIFSCEPL